MAPESSFPKKPDLLALRSILRPSEDHGCAVYFLCSGIEIVYVGESINAVRRVADHRRQARIEFDDVLIQPCKRSERVLLEREWIEILRPRFNIAFGYAGWPAGRPRLSGPDIRRSGPMEPSMSTDLVDPLASVRAYLEAEKADNTRRAYRADWADFLAWCEKASDEPMPASPTVVARYLAWLADAGLSTSTIERRCAAIRYAHRAADLEPPTNSEGVKAVMRGIRRTHGAQPIRKKPATAEILTAAIALLPDNLMGKRDRALLLVGFAAALRRSELVDLKVNDIEFRPKGMMIQIRRSKTDQDGKGAMIPVPNGGKLQAVAALSAWLEAAGITEGSIFRPIDRHGRIAPAALSDHAVAAIVKKVLGAAGLDASVFSGHSLRAGFVTSALANKVDAFKIMGITRHVKVDTLKGYDRRENGFEDHAGDDFL